ncbi:MAG: polyphenol oxidase family protein [Candidatus Dormibacteraeota bacterium]|nr:polyphenol oxidase family protein [Candidatus Dormibacteraeota bacterium]
MPAALQIAQLAAEPSLVHAFSTVAMGSMGLTHAADPGLVAESRRQFARALGVEPEGLTVVGAVHGVEVARVDRPAPLVEGVDGIVTDQPGVALFAVFADCYPLLVYDPRNHALGLAHAGWRGTLAGITRKVVSRLEREYGSVPSELSVGIGPGICGNCYEVGPEFAQRFPPEVLKAGTGGRLLLDLGEANRRHFLEAGVLEERIATAGLCTLESDRLFSHRRQPDGTRFAALGVLR